MAVEFDENSLWYWHTGPEAILIAPDGLDIVVPPNSSWYTNSQDEWLAAYFSMRNLASGLPIGANVASGLTADLYDLLANYDGAGTGSAVQSSVYGTIGAYLLAEHRFPEHTDLRATQQPLIRSEGAARVDLGSGEFHLEETDLEIPSDILPFSFTRTYKSGFPYFGPFGWNWDHNHNQYLRLIDDDSIRQWTGRLYENTFKRYGSTEVFFPTAGAPSKLEQQDSREFIIYERGKVELLFKDPDNAVPDALTLKFLPLYSITDRFGNRLMYEYEYPEPEGQAGLFRLKRVVLLPNGRSINTYQPLRQLVFSYGECHLLESVTDQWLATPIVDLRRVDYWHDPDVEHLVRVVSPATTDHEDGTTREYEYLPLHEVPELRHNIRFVHDGKGVTFIENEYVNDPSDPNFSRVHYQTIAEEQYHFDYESILLFPPLPEFLNEFAFRTVMTAPDGGETEYTFNFRGDLKMHRIGVTDAVGVPSIIVTEHEYDLAGNRVQTDYQDGTVETTEYLFDSGDPTQDPRLKGLPISHSLSRSGESRLLWRRQYDMDDTHAQDLLFEWDERACDVGSLGPSEATQFDYTTGDFLKITRPDVTRADGTPEPGVAEITIKVDSFGRVTEVRSATGIVTTYDYGTTSSDPSFDRLVKATVAGSLVPFELTYNNIGFLASSTDIAGNTTEYSYNELGQLEQVLLPSVGAGQTPVVNHYDKNHYLSSIEHPAGSFTELGFSDGFILEKRKINAAGFLTESSFGSNTSVPYILKQTVNHRGDPLRIFRPDGSVERHSYDQRGLLKKWSVTGSDGSSNFTKHLLNPVGLEVKKILGPAQDVATYSSYFVTGDIKETQFGTASGTKKVTTKRTLDWTSTSPIPVTAGTHNRIISEFDCEAGGSSGSEIAQRFQEFDERGRLVLQTVADYVSLGSINYLTTQFFYDKDDRLTRIIGPRGEATQYTYDALGRVTRVTDPLINWIDYNYTALPVIVISHLHVEPGGGTTTRIYEVEFDARGRKIRYSEPGDIDYLFAYDDRNLLVRQVLPNGVAEEREYGLKGNLTKRIEDADGTPVTHEWLYDSEYRVVKYIDPSLQETDYVYDGIGRLTRTLYPDGSSVEHVFGVDGRLAKNVLASGVEVNYTYDGFGRLALMTSAGVGGSEPVSAIANRSYSYDALDRITNASVSGGPVVSRSYDSLGRQLLETSHGHTLEASYDTLAGTIKKLWPDGREETHSLNLNGVVEKIEVTSAGGSIGSGLTTLVDNLKTSGPSLFGEASLPGSITRTATYDNRKRISSLQYLSAGMRADYRYDVNSRRAIEALDYDFGGTQRGENRLYEFDALDRLTSFKVITSGVSLSGGATQGDHDSDISDYGSATGTQVVITYNPGGERTSYGGIDYDYTAGHRLSEVNSVFVADQYVDGPFKSVDGMNLSIDALGRTTDIDSGDVTLTYDALGRPSVLEIAGELTREFCYFGEELWLELSGGSADRHNTHHDLMNGYVAIHTTGNLSYICVNDARMNRLMLLDMSGDWAEDYQYDVFGVEQFTPTLLESFFGGLRYLSSKGLYLSRQRLLAPQYGMFLSPDPREYVDSPNRYAYAGHDPSDFVDPFGMQKEEPQEKAVTAPSEHEPEPTKRYQGKEITVTADRVNVQESETQQSAPMNLRGNVNRNATVVPDKTSTQRIKPVQKPLAPLHRLELPSIDSFFDRSFKQIERSKPNQAWPQSASDRLNFDPWLFPSKRIQSGVREETKDVWQSPYVQAPFAGVSFLTDVSNAVFEEVGSLTRQNLRHLGRTRFSNPASILRYRGLISSASPAMHVLGKFTLVGGGAMEVYNFAKDPSWAQAGRSAVNIFLPTILMAGGPIGWGLAAGYIVSDMLIGKEMWGTKY